MTKVQLITLFVTVIASGVVAPFFKAIFDRVFASYNPDRKKILSLIKKVLGFAFRYLLPVYSIVILYINDKVLDKWFVLQLFIYFSIILFNLFMDTYFYLRKSDTEYLSLLKDMSTTMKKVAMNQEKHEYDTKQQFDIINNDLDKFRKLTTKHGYKE